MTFSKGDIAIYLIVGLGFFTVLTGFVFAMLTDRRTDDDPSESTAHWRDDERR